MKKFLVLSFISFVLFSSCKSTTLMKKKEYTSKKLSNKQETSINTKLLKIYFPSFITKDDSSKKERVVWGDGILVILPDNKVMVVDCFDSEGSEKLISFLKSLGIKKIDYFFASHNHMDHIGNVPDLLTEFSIEHYYWNGVHFNSHGDKVITETLENNNIERTILKQGDSIIVSQEPLCRLEVLWPNLTEKDIYNAFYNPGKTEKLKNNTSLVFKLIYNDFSILFTGDIYKEVEKKLIKKYGKELKSTILKVPHHGESYKSNSFSFVKSVNAEYSILQDPQYVNILLKSIYKLGKSKLLYNISEKCILVTSDGQSYSINNFTY